MYFSAASDRGRLGAIKGGRLKLAKMVSESRKAKVKSVMGGTGRADTVPYILVNWESLIMVNPTLATLVAANLSKPADVRLAGRARVVDLKVSKKFALKYVPP